MVEQPPSRRVVGFTKTVQDEVSVGVDDRSSLLIESIKNFTLGVSHRFH